MGCKLWPVMVAMGLVLGSIPASAEFYNGNKFYDRCQKQGNDFCFGFLMGVIDTIEDSKLMCVPTGVTAQQVYDIVMKYMRERPQDRHYGAADLAVKALRAVYPCR